MGLAVDTILVDANNPGATFANAAVVAGNGDTLTIRNFPPQNSAKIVDVVRRHGTAGGTRIISALMHDNVTGMTWYSTENPSILAMPDYFGQPVQPGDTLTVQVTGASNAHCSVGIVVRYDNLTGAQANLFMLGDIQNAIKSIKPMTVAVTASGTVGLWADTLITATEAQLHASSYYAVLGYGVDAALGLVGFKSQATGNFRICGPGSTNMEDTSDYFVGKSQAWGVPYIPVFSGQDRGAAYVSVADNVASTTANVTLILAELQQGNWSRA
jgi:hypothetical protein